MKADQIHRGPVELHLEQQPPIGVPLFHAAWLFAGGIVIAHYVWLRPAWLLLSLAPILILASLAAFRAQRLIWLPVGVLWCIPRRMVC